MARVRWRFRPNRNQFFLRRCYRVSSIGTKEQRSVGGKNKRERATGAAAIGRASERANFQPCCAPALEPNETNTKCRLFIKRLAFDSRQSPIPKCSSLAIGISCIINMTFFILLASSPDRDKAERFDNEDNDISSFRTSLRALTRRKRAELNLHKLNFSGESRSLGRRMRPNRLCAYVEAEKFLLRQINHNDRANYSNERKWTAVPPSLLRAAQRRRTRAQRNR